MNCFLQGDRFGGALDGAAKMFSEAYDSGTIPMEFVNNMRKQGKLILGIGHRIKSVSRCFILKPMYCNYHWLICYHAKIDSTFFMHCEA